MNRMLIIAMLAAALLLTGCEREARPAAESISRAEEAAAAPSFTCPMHPHYISTDPDGACPICGMDLVPGARAGSPDGSEGEPEILYYKNPMGQADTSPVPKKDWMGMDYVPVYTDAASGSGLVVPAEMIQTMGVRTVRAEMVAFGRGLRAFGTVETNERLENVSVSRLTGWIEDLAVRANGDIVAPGALLYRIYSPDLIAAQKDFLNALEIGNPKRIASVRQRLRSVGMQPGVIARIEETRTIVERVPVYAEAGGVVAELTVREGDYVEPGTPVLRLQSYADVWVIAKVPENDLALIDIGMPVRLAFPSAPDAPSDGRIDYVYPEIDPLTRTARVRIEADNALGSLRPGAYADIRMDLGSEPRLSVPTESILRDSQGARVIIALGDGRFEGRNVRTGISADEQTEILAGLKTGELVVASGQFLLDSEASLREGLAKLQVTSAVKPRLDTPLSSLAVDAATLAELDHFTDAALYLHEALTDGYAPRPEFFDPALALGAKLAQEFADTRLEVVLIDASGALKLAQTSTDRSSQQNALSQLAEELGPWWLEGAPIHYRDKGLGLFRDADTGRLWIQQGVTPLNPYSAGKAEIIAWPDPMLEIRP